MRCRVRPARALFNPDLFASDALFSLIEFLCDAVQRTEPPPPERLVKTVGWQGVWLRVASEPRAAGMVARQFEVREHPLAHGSEEARVYASEFLPLPGAKGAT